MSQPLNEIKQARRRFDEMVDQAAAAIADRENQCSACCGPYGTETAAEYWGEVHDDYVAIGKAYMAAFATPKPTASSGEVERALETIARTKVGLGGIIEDYGHDTNAYNYHAMVYWQKLAQWYQDEARKALAALSTNEHSTVEITMQDVRLYAGEGRLTAGEVLAACNAYLRSSRSAVLYMGNVPLAPEDATDQVDSLGGEKAG